MGAQALVTEGLAEDIGWLHRLMRRHYAAYIDLVQHPSFDVEGFFSEWRADVRTLTGTGSVRAALMESLVRLRQAVPDRHLVFPAVDAALATDERIAVHEYQAAIDHPERGVHDSTGIRGAYPTTWRTAPVLRTDGRLATLATVSASGPGATREVRFGPGTLRLERRTRPTHRGASADPPAYRWHRRDGVGILALRTFTGGAAVAAQLRRFVEDHPLHVQQPVLVFDLRGNGGGSLEYVQHWLARALGGTLRRQPLLDLAPCLCGNWNRLLAAQVRAATVDAVEARKERASLRAQCAPTPPVARIQWRTPVSRAPAGPRYAGRVFVLIDRDTGSSGELAAWELTRNLNAILLGERSAGCMQYGQACRFVLPDTGLVVQLPTRRFFYDAPVEAVGLPVDAYLEDPLQDTETIVGHLEAVAWAAQRSAKGPTPSVEGGGMATTMGETNRRPPCEPTALKWSVASGLA